MIEGPKVRFNFAGSFPPHEGVVMDEKSLFLCVELRALTSCLRCVIVVERRREHVRVSAGEETAFVVAGRACVAGFFSHRTSSRLSRHAPLLPKAQHLV